MNSPTMGHPSRPDESVLVLIAAVFRQAAQDYKYAVRWMTKHAKKKESRKYLEMSKLKKDVVRFTKSPLYEAAIGDRISPDAFLKKALEGVDEVQ